MRIKERLLSVATFPGPWLLGQIKALIWTVAFSSLFLFSQSYALSIQNIQMNSALGEPLDAVVHISAAPGEVLSAKCISVRPGADDAMPSIRGVKLSLSRSLTPGTIRLTSTQVMREPMSEIVVRVQCPGAPTVQRTFLVMLDPPVESTLASAPGYATTPITSASNTVRSATSLPAFSSQDPRIRVAASRSVYAGGQIVNPGSTYTVENGDTLSTIAERVEGRELDTVWGWAATIQVANPEAFINGNPNELIAGRSIFIPAARTRGLATQQLRTGGFANGSTINRSNASNQSSPSVRSGAASTTQSAAVSSNSNRISNTLAAVNAELSSNLRQTTASGNTLETNASLSVGNTAGVQPTFVMAKNFSQLSLSRLQQRKSGLIQAVPNNLPDFVSSSTPEAPLEDPVAGSQTPVIPVNNKPELGLTGTNNNRRFSLLTLFGGLGLLALAFLGGLLVATLRSRRKIDDAVQAKLVEARYHKRVMDDHRDVTDKVLRGGVASGGIEVTESDRNEAIEARDAAFAESSDNLDDVQTVVESDSLDINLADPLDNNFARHVGSDHDADTSSNHALTSIDLELLEQDYASQQENSLEDIASAGRGDKTEIMKSSLDLEFPDDVRGHEESFEPLNYTETADSDSIDFDVGALSRTDETVEGLSIDFSDAGAELDAELLALTNNLDLDLDVEETLEPESYDLESVDEPVDESFAATSTRDAEEFYHLEASSIMNVGELSFEQDLDDETNILKFRQRNMKTGTDDSGADDE